VHLELSEKLRANRARVCEAERREIKKKLLARKCVRTYLPVRKSVKCDFIAFENTLRIHAAFGAESDALPVR